MATHFAERQEVEPGDTPTMGKGPRRWTFGRIATDLAIILVGVPFGLGLFAPPWPRGGCGMTAEFYASSLGLAILAVRPTWLALKALNDAGERWLDAQADARSRRKPKPLDDP